tara:strand:- start:1693 stop:1830 length:138 start_codon:yes stop_codon:yes gene_type:complete
MLRLVSGYSRYIAADATASMRKATMDQAFAGAGSGELRVTLAYFG